DSCGKSGTGETPQERKRRGGSAAARGKRSLARKSTAVSQAVQLMSPVCFYIRFISLCLSLVFSSQKAKSQRNRTILWLFTWLLTDNL
ncbi:hypothetical protein, partial [Priestia aryabhattai]|uniref:hypothetical protein n=2 Tax=Priestia TaxID=2800373 RepID=UPI001C8D6B1C|nr:hypothetical protein [Priestia aryabhattai]MBX9998525.1 hypothetical protein [Priestia aryabhattai]